MKKLLLLLLALVSFTSFAQALENSTYYKAEVNTDGGQKYWYYFYVNSGGYVRQVDSSGKYGTQAVHQTMYHKATTSYAWLNASGIWTENQSFIFTKNLDNGKIYLHFMRVVQNEGDIPWSVVGVAVVESYKIY